MNFSQPSITELEEKYVIDAMRTSRLSGDGKYTKRVYEIFREHALRNQVTKLDAESHIIVQADDGIILLAECFTDFSVITGHLFLESAVCVFIFIEDFR